MIEPVVSGVAAFAATNFDDLFLLILWFSRARSDPRAERMIIAGQYLGFSLLILISVLVYIGTLLVPREYVGLLGILPITLGLRELLSLRRRGGEEAEVLEADAPPGNVPRVLRSRLFHWLDPDAAAVAVVTVANGSDNLAVYPPLFAAGGVARMIVIILVLLVMVGVWCALADRLAEHPLTAAPLRKYGPVVMPFVLIGIGLLILIESGAFRVLALQ
jgi:cadmium resistance protein CadD (predicted permease)